MGLANSLFGFKFQVSFISAVLIPEHIYSMVGGDLPAELQNGAGALMVIFVTTLALASLLACWVRIFVQLHRSQNMSSRQRMTWAMIVLLASYGLIGYYHYIYKRHQLTHA